MPSEYADNVKEKPKWITSNIYRKKQLIGAVLITLMLFLLRFVNMSAVKKKCKMLDLKFKYDVINVFNMCQNFSFTI